MRTSNLSYRYLIRSRFDINMFIIEEDGKLTRILSTCNIEDILVKYVSDPEKTNPVSMSYAVWLAIEVI